MVKKLLGEGISLKAALASVGMSRSTYGYKKREGSCDGRHRGLDKGLVKAIEKLPSYEGCYGYRKVAKFLGGYNHKKVYRHMKALNLLQPKKLKKRAKKRLEMSCPVKANVRWEADMTYVWDGQRMNYLFNTIDCFDKEPIGDYYGLRCRAEEAIVSLEEAVKTRFGSLEPSEDIGVTLRIDQGPQYVSKKFKKRAKELGVALEYCGINCPDDKPYIESFFSRYKCEEVYRNEYRSFTEGLIGWIEYKQWYKTKRIHQGLGYQSIPEFQQRHSLL